MSRMIRLLSACLAAASLAVPVRANAAANNAAACSVSIDYFNDVGVFVAVGFNTRLTIHGGGGIESTSGSHGTFVSSGVNPPVVGGNHVTNYTLICRRA